MKSTPAVFCTPALSDGSTTPSLSSPSIADIEPYPWAVSTPESSPRRWDRVPSWQGCQHEVAMPVDTREQLRSVCEPFFEEMLTAMQHGLHTQMHPGSKLAEITEAMACMASKCFQSSFQPMSCSITQASIYEESTGDESGAFACLLSGPSSGGESADELEAKSLSSVRDLDQGSDSEKNTMVCRHWKSKGWCKLEDNCKFLHPEHKRGIAAPSAPSKNAAGAKVEMTLDGEVPPAPLARRRKRGGKNRSSKFEQMVQFSHEAEYAAACQASFFSEEYMMFCTPCASVM